MAQHVAQGVRMLASAVFKRVYKLQSGSIPVLGTPEVLNAVFKGLQHFLYFLIIRRIFSIISCSPIVISYSTQKGGNLI